MTSEHHCHRCRTPLAPGIYIAQTLRGGLPDFPGDAYATTLSPGGPGKLADCLKCPTCGWSRTKTETDR